MGRSVCIFHSFIHSFIQYDDEQLIVILVREDTLRLLCTHHVLIRRCKPPVFIWNLDLRKTVEAVLPGKLYGSR